MKHLKKFESHEDVNLDVDGVTWIEQRPNEGDTVKVKFADWTKKGTKIGVFLRYFDDNAIIDFGQNKEYLDKDTTFYVLKRN